MSIPPDDPSQQDENQDELSPDPSENLRLENELLKLKMQAEIGAEFGGDISELPPEIERQILKQVMRFHEAQSGGEVTTVGKQLGQEAWPEARTFRSEAALTEAWDALQERLTRARLHVGFLADYPLSLKWDFITQELMKKEIFPIAALDVLQFGSASSDVEESTIEGDEQDTGGQLDADAEKDEEVLRTSELEDVDESESWDVPKMSTGLTGVGFVGFIYEEYHPNHAHAIEHRVQDFLKDFFEGSFTEHSSGLSNQMVSESGQVVTHEVFREKFTRFHDLFPGGITEWEFSPHETAWETPLNEENRAAKGTGYMCGEVRYIVTMDDGAESEITGPFKTYLEYSDDWWSVSFFQLHGFSWM